MIYELNKRRTFTLDNEFRDMILMEDGDRVKIDGANVYIWVSEAGEWWLTIDIVTKFLLKDLKELSTE